MFILEANVLRVKNMEIKKMKKNKSNSLDLMKDIKLKNLLWPKDF